MKILAMDKLKEGVTIEQIMPYFKEEMRMLWKMYEEGVVRKFYKG